MKKKGQTMTSKLWIERTRTLLGRLQYIGLDAGIAAPSLIAAWGVYCTLSNLRGGA